MLKKLQLILTLTLLIATTMQITFEVEVKRNERWCFQSFLGESTPYHFQTTASINAKYELSHLFSTGDILYKNSNDSYYVKRFDSYAAVTGEYEFCIENLSTPQPFVIVFLEGIQLSDVNNIPAQEDSKHIDTLVESLNKVFQEVKEREQYTMMINEYSMELQKMVSFKSVGFGFLSITVVLIISFLHYLEIKRMLHNRKVI